MTEGVNLAAIEEIRLLKARYLRALDTKDWPLLRSLLTDDMVGDFREMPGGPPDEKLLTTGADAFVAGVAAELDEATTVHHVHSSESALPARAMPRASGRWTIISGRVKGAILPAGRATDSGIIMTAIARRAGAG